MCRILALLLLTTATHADTTVMWGGSSATLGPCRDADACVTVINMLTATPDEVMRVLDVDGFRVLVTVHNGPGNDPDTVTMAVPRGFRVDPQVQVIEEGHSAVFRIFAPLMG